MMALFMDKRGRLAKLYRSTTVKFHDITEWDLGTLLVTTDPFDVVVLLCVAYVVTGDTYCIARIAQVQYDKMVGYRLVIQTTGDGRDINLISKTVAASNLIRAQLVLPSWENSHSDAAAIFGNSPIIADPQFNLGMNAGLRLFGERLEEMIATAYRLGHHAKVGQAMYQHLMQLENRHVLPDIRSLGMITGYYTGIRNLQVIGDGRKADPILARAAYVRALSGITENLNYHRSLLTEGAAP